MRWKEWDIEQIWRGELPVSRLSVIDLMFLLLENQHRPVHMSSCVVFDPPARSKGHFVTKVMEAFRASEVGEPFNRKLKWLGDGLASWERCEPDLDYHVRRVAVPEPGGREQLADTLALLNAPLLDRAYPLWQCFVIEGLANGQFALFFKMHHAIIDGEGGVKVFQGTLSTDPKDATIRPFWAPQPSTGRSKAADPAPSGISGLISAVGKLPAETAGMASGLLKLGAETLKGGLPRGSLPFQAPGTPFNVPTTTSARAYANCELPLDTVKAISKASRCTVNDVVMTLIDHALNRYLVAEGRGVDQPLVAAMPVSARVEGQGAAGNQVSSDLVPMGKPGASLAERLVQIHASTSRVKAKAQKLTVPVRQAYSLLLLGATALPDLVPGYTAPPTYNVIISNMAGPRGQFYTGGAALVGLIGMPIVPPTPGLNITFLSFNDQICLAVGCTPETMSDPGSYVRMLEEDFGKLRQAFIPAKPARKKRAAKKAPRKRAPRSK